MKILLNSINFFVMCIMSKTAFAVCNKRDEEWPKNCARELGGLWWDNTFHKYLYPIGGTGFDFRDEHERYKNDEIAKDATWAENWGGGGEMTEKELREEEKKGTRFVWVFEDAVKEHLKLNKENEEKYTGRDINPYYGFALNDEDVIWCKVARKQLDGRRRARHAGRVGCGMQ
jgi:hypothetical protein